jgi:hypothetical protein
LSLLQMICLLLGFRIIVGDLGKVIFDIKDIQRKNKTFLFQIPDDCMNFINF